jgi:hypothetical protein
LIDFLCVGDKARGQYQCRRAIHDEYVDRNVREHPDQRVGIRRQDRKSDLLAHSLLPKMSDDAAKVKRWKWKPCDGSVEIKIPQPYSLS